MFQFSPLAPLRVTGHCACGVAPFGYLRIKVWSATPRSFSQLSHVLLRLLVPRHPPKALSSLTHDFFPRDPLESQFQTSHDGAPSLVLPHAIRLTTDRALSSTTIFVCQRTGNGQGHSLRTEQQNFDRSGCGTLFPEGRAL